VRTPLFLENRSCGPVRLAASQEEADAPRWPNRTQRKPRLKPKAALAATIKPKTTLNNGYLGSRNDEERSEMRYVV